MTASIEEGLVVAVVESEVKGEAGVGKPEKSNLDKPHICGVEKWSTLGVPMRIRVK